MNTASNLNLQFVTPPPPLPHRPGRERGSDRLKRLFNAKVGEGRGVCVPDGKGTAMIEVERGPAASPKSPRGEEGEGRDAPAHFHPPSRRRAPPPSTHPKNTDQGDASEGAMAFAGAKTVSPPHPSAPNLPWRAKLRDQNARNAERSSCHCRSSKNHCPVAWRSQKWSDTSPPQHTHTYIHMPQLPAPPN